jgi:hypothetical protein
MIWYVKRVEHSQDNAGNNGKRKDHTGDGDERDFVKFRPVRCLAPTVIPRQIIKPRIASVLLTGMR